MEKPRENQFRYLDVRLHLGEGSSRQLDKETFKGCILRGLLEIFGEFGACFPVDLIHFNSDTDCDKNKATCGGILRCPVAYYVQFRAALTLIGEYDNCVCCFDIRDVADPAIHMSMTD